MSRLSATVTPLQCRVLGHQRLPLIGGREWQQVRLEFPQRHLPLRSRMQRHVVAGQGRPVLVEEGGYSVACEGEEGSSGGTASPAGACSHSVSSTSG